MAVWDALSNTMRTVRKRRIGPHEAERLLTAERIGSDHVELSLLLAAAAAPPRPDELIGYESAMAAFAQAGREAEATPMPVGRGRRRWLPLPRSVAAKAVLGAAVALTGGVAYAAETGRLPDAAQRHAHELFSPLGVPAPTTPPPTAGRGSPTATPTGAGRTLDPGEPAALGLCRAWKAARANPNGSPMAAEAFQDLAEAAGGERDVPAFCARLLASPASRVPAPPGPTPDPEAVIPSPSHPGGSKGHGRPTAIPTQKR